MSYVVATLGSAGDLHPFLAVARALQEQGERVVLMAQEPHRAEVCAQGLEFLPILDTPAHERTLQHPGLWHPINGFGVLWRHMAVPAIDITFTALEQICATSTERVKVLASPLVIGARLARELLPLRLITAHTAPMGLRSCGNPMFLGSWQVPNWLPRWPRSLLWQALDHYKLEPMAAPRLNAWRLAHGLEKLHEPVFNRWIHSPDAVVGMFPADFGPMPTDWPVNPILTGFPLYENSTEDQLTADAELNQFCRRTELPLVIFFPGSAARSTHTSIHIAAEILAKQQHAKCLLLGNFPKIAHVNCLNRKKVSLAQVLPYAKVFMHHGGIGCCAQGLAAAVPQVIFPSAYDQYDNGERLRLIGAGRWIRPVSSPSELTQSLVREIRLSLEAPRRTKPVSCKAQATSHPNKPNEAVRQICEQLRLL